MKIADYLKLHDDIVEWIHTYTQTNNIESLVVGLSGGIDSAVVAMLCIDMVQTYKDVRVICVMMPYDISDAESYARSLKFKRNVEFFGADADFYTHEIKSIVNAYDLDRYSGYKQNILSGNLRARVRANILYDVAGATNGIVVGTGNLDENELGYFTKGGDGLTDILPIGNLHKYEVYELAKVFMIDIPQEIINATPSANLWEGQTDEDELGMTYNEVAWAIDTITGHDSVLSTPEPTRAAEVLARVKEMQKKTEHKRRMPPVFR